MPEGNVKRGIAHLGKIKSQVAGILCAQSPVASTTTDYLIPSRFPRFFLRGVLLNFGNITNITSVDIGEWDFSGGVVSTSTVTFTAFAPSSGSTYFCSVDAGKSWIMESAGPAWALNDNKRITLPISKPFSYNSADSIAKFYNGVGIGIKVVAGATPLINLSASLIVDPYDDPRQ